MKNFISFSTILLLVLILFNVNYSSLSASPTIEGCVDKSDEAALVLITCPPNLTVSCVSQIPIPDPLPPNVTATDNCGGHTPAHLGDVITNMTCVNRFLIIRTYIATDNCGATSTCVQLITVHDNTPPAITCPANVTVQCASMVPAVNTGTLSATDCTGSTPVFTHVGDVISNQTCANNFIISRTYQATDPCGNTATCIQTITIGDNTGPAITCPQNITVSCANQVPPPGTPTTTDNCTGTPVTITVGPDVITNQTCANNFTITRTYFATDVCANSSSCIQTIVVSDVALSIPAPGGSTVDCVSDAQVVPTPPVVISCGTPVTPVGPTIGPDPVCSGTKTYTWTYTDCAGTPHPWVYTYNIVPPVSTLPAGGYSTVACISDAQITPVPPAASNNICGDPITVTGPVVSPDPYCMGTKTYTWDYVDCSGASVSWTYTYTISPPTFLLPTNAGSTIGCINDAVPPVVPLVLNSCGDVLTPTGPIVSADPICSGTKTYTYTFTDCTGNASQWIYTYNLVSTVLPTITCPSDVTVSCPGLVPSPDPTTVIALDNCGGTPVVTHVGDVTTSGACPQQYTITRTYLAVDACSNSATCTQSIVVHDNTAPVINCPNNVTVQCNVITYSATATDNCGGPVTVSFSPPSGSSFPQGTTTVTVTATDVCGNSTTCSFTVTNYLGSLANYHMIFTDGKDDANWQGPTKGYIGDVVVDGVQAVEKSSGTLPYAGTIMTNATTLSQWQNIVNANPGQATSSLNQATTVTQLQSELENAFTLINALPVSVGYDGVTPASLNNILNTTNGVADQTVINVNSGFTVTTKINITGDATDLFILRWDTDKIFSNGYNGDVKFQGGGAIVPKGGLTAANFIHVAGDLRSGQGGTNPPVPYPQGPRYNNGTGALITGGANFNGGGFFTGYWLTTGAPTINGSGQPYGRTSAFNSAIFVGGWYTKTTKFNLTNGSSGVYVSPCPNLNIPLIANDIIDIDHYGNSEPIVLMNVYPNPSEDLFTLKTVGSQHESTLIEVYDILGQKQMEFQTVDGDHREFGDDLQNGIYLIRASRGEVSQVMKVIKQSAN